jgi:hypothetical protein
MFHRVNNTQPFTLRQLRALLLHVEARAFYLA